MTTSQRDVNDTTTRASRNLDLGVLVVVKSRLAMLGMDVLLENWYIFPIPKFELADRNFNVWWKEQKIRLALPT